MPDMEALLAETFGFEMFEHIEALQKQIDDTLGRYDDDVLSADDLADAAGGADLNKPDSASKKGEIYENHPGTVQ